MRHINSKSIVLHSMKETIERASSENQNKRAYKILLN